MANMAEKAKVAKSRDPRQELLGRCAAAGEVIASGAISHEALEEDFRKMLLIRQFELRAENAYREGFIGGFFHSYAGQEAIQTAALRALGPDHWWVTSYRCHALALLLGASCNEVMSELYGKKNGNALGRGGSMHLYTDRLLGGFGIVGGQIPIATGAALSLKRTKEYKKGQKLEEIAICFLGDGAVAQGAFHESLNLASLWDLPVLYVIENNQWGMGTAVHRALAAQPIASVQAPSYGMEAMQVDGMDYFACLDAFSKARSFITTQCRPLIMEVDTERFRGHSVSDPGVYRSKEELEKSMERDPLDLMEASLLEQKVIDSSWRKGVSKEITALVKESLRFAQESEDPDPSVLEEGVYA